MTSRITRKSRRIVAREERAAAITVMNRMVNDWQWSGKQRIFDDINAALRAREAEVFGAAASAPTISFLKVRQGSVRHFTEVMPYGDKYWAYDEVP